MLYAASFEQGLILFEQQKYKQAKKIWLPLAQNGDARAQYNLALLMLKGNNQQQAQQYFSLSQDNGLIDSYYRIASLEHIKSEGVDNRDNDHNVVVNNTLSWLKQQNKNYYTIQLATAKTKKLLDATLLKLVDNKSLVQAEHLYIHKIYTKKQNKEKIKLAIRYVLIYGSFKSYQQAREGVEKLPKEYQNSKPWIRKFSILQSLVVNH
jgi:hypothetical protein